MCAPVQRETHSRFISRNFLLHLHQQSPPSPSCHFCGDSIVGWLVGHFEDYHCCYLPQLASGSLPPKLTVPENGEGATKKSKRLYTT